MTAPAMSTRRVPRHLARLAALFAPIWLAAPAIAEVADVADAATQATESTESRIVTERISYDFQGDPFHAWLVHDAARPTPRPAVLLFHEWWGLDEFALEQATALAEAGYVVFCADMYGMQPSGDNIVATTPQEAQRLSGRLYRDRIWMRQLATTAYLMAAKQEQIDPRRIASVGYGFGGTVALELARSGAVILGTVSFHGGLHNPSPADAGRIRGDVLILQGTQDPMVPDAEIDAFEAEMDAAGARYEVIRFSGAAHAFSNRRSDGWNIPGAGFNQRAADLSAIQVGLFLQRTLGGPTPGRARITDGE